MKDGDAFLHLDQMLDACQRATSFIDGLIEEDFLADERTQSAVAMQLLIIGEAAANLRRVSPEFQAGYPELAWKNMVGMGNRIAHGYFDLNFQVIWHTVSVEVPELLKRLQAIYVAAGETISDRTTRKTNSD